MYKIIFSRNNFNIVLTIVHRNDEKCKQVERKANKWQEIVQNYNKAKQKSVDCMPLKFNLS